MKEEAEKGQGLERVVFCCFEAKDERAYQRLIPYVNLDSLDRYVNTVISAR